MNRRLFISLLLLLSVVGAHADDTAYRDNHEVTATKGTLTFYHVHNWDAPRLDPLFSDLTRHERFFSAANDFAYVELRDGNRVLFRSPSSALTHLWISPDAQFFVGLSRVMLRNPYQLVIWKRDGSLMHKEHISAEVAKLSSEQRLDFVKRFPKAERFFSGRYFTHGNSTYLDYDILGVINGIGDAAWDYLFPLRVRHPYSDDFSESVTNWIEWFDEAKPDLSIAQTATESTLSLRSPTGKRVTIPIKLHKTK